MESVKGKPVIAFDLFADYAQLKKYYTTMSPLSFAIPPGTVIRGLLGALIGVDKEESPEYFNDVDLSLQIKHPVKKVNIPENLLKTTSKRHFSRFEQHKPTNIEFVKDVRYRIYLKTSDKDLFDQIKEQLINHQSVYTLSIGISEALANFDQVEETICEKSVDGMTHVNSIIPVDLIDENNVQFDDREIFTVKLPMKMKNDREVIEYREFIYERQGRSIEAKVKDLIQLANGEHVVFF